MSCCAKAPELSTSSSTLQKSEEQIREAVRAHYANIVTSSDKSVSNGCCSSSETAGSCFAPSKDVAYANKLGYSADDLAAVPDGANIGQGCGNPVMFAKMNAGETVLDLGSGAGFDAFIAARAVGVNGHVIGVDMTPEMISKAREKALKGGSIYKNVEFRLGEIEHLPVADGTVDVVISNCVINLVPNKSQAFKEVARVLKKGGRICISDVVTSMVFSEAVRNDLKLYAGCLAGATLITDLEKILKDVGLTDIKITPNDESKEFIKTWVPESKFEDFVISALIEAKKPF